MNKPKINVISFPDKFIEGKNKSSKKREFNKYKHYLEECANNIKTEDGLINTKLWI